MDLPLQNPLLNLQVWLMGCAISGISGSRTAIPVLVRPSEQVEPTAAAIRFGSVWV